MNPETGDATGRVMRAWARRLVAATAAAGGDDHADREPTDPIDPIGVVAAVVDAVARALPGAVLDPDRLVDADLAARSRPLRARLPEPPMGWADPRLPGVVHEQAVSATRRSARGAWYTPPAVVAGLAELATADGRAPISATDPTCGGGAFLLAMLDRYRSLGVDPDEALTRTVGTDIDPDAVQTSRWSMQLWAAANGIAVDPDALWLRVADVLAPTDHPADPTPSGTDRAAGDTAGPLVIGNPPFATPLRSGRLPETAEAFRAANRDLLGPYSDLAASHLLAALRAAGPTGTVALILPQSVLAGRDTHALRAHCDEAAPLQALWATRTAVFDAGVRACAVVLGPRPSSDAGDGGSRPPVVLAAGPAVTPVERTDAAEVEPGRWAGHAARALGAPALPASVTTTDAGTLADLATATAGFRDEYYGLVGACREWDGADGEEPNRLVTVGSVDPLELAWGRRSCRLGGRNWDRPVIDVAALDAKVGAWVEQRLVPKVVLATQSKVLEPVVDRSGHLIPATPLIALAAPDHQLDLVAAVLLAPPVVAWAWQRWFGASLSVDALKLAARQVLDLPLPPDQAAWREAAALVASAEQADPTGAAELADQVAACMNRAYGADPEVLAWWRARSPAGPSMRVAPDRPSGPGANGPG